MQRSGVQLPSAPLLGNKKPFDQNVEGLSYLTNEGYVVESAVQKHDFQDSTLCRVIRPKPQFTKRLRNFKHFHRQFSRFVVRAVYGHTNGREFQCLDG